MKEMLNWKIYLKFCRIFYCCQQKWETFFCAIWAPIYCIPHIISYLFCQISKFRGIIVNHGYLILFSINRTAKIVPILCLRIWNWFETRNEKNKFWNLFSVSKKQISKIYLNMIKQTIKVKLWKYW